MTSTPIVHPGTDRKGPGMTTLVPERFHIPEASLECLRRAAVTLSEAILTEDPAEHYALAHVSALRATAAVLAARARPTGRAARQRNAWLLLRQVAPEFAEWADFFAAGAGKRAAAEAGARNAASAREADDLVRDADHFLAVVETSFGLTGRVA